MMAFPVNETADFNADAFGQPQCECPLIRLRLALLVHPVTRATIAQPCGLGTAVAAISSEPRRH